MNQRRPRYVPALGWDLLTPLYDPLVRWTTREERFKRRLIERSGVKDARRVLDIGCGTGTLLLWAVEYSQAISAIGLDGDIRVLRRARSKTEKASATVAWVRAFSCVLPFADQSFDCAFSSLMLHHLTHPEKLRTLDEVYRVLQPGGEFQVADWGRPHNGLMKVLSLPIRIGDRFNRTTDNIKGLLPTLFSKAGFVDVCEQDRFGTCFGTLSVYRAARPKVRSDSETRIGR